MSTRKNIDGVSVQRNRIKSDGRCCCMPACVLLASFSTMRATMAECFCPLWRVVGHSGSQELGLLKLVAFAGGRLFGEKSEQWVLFSTVYSPKSHIPPHSALFHCITTVSTPVYKEAILVTEKHRANFYIFVHFLPRLSRNKHSQVISKASFCWGHSS